MLTLNVFLSFVISLEAAIQNNLTKSWKFSIEMSVVEFRYSMKLQYSSMVRVKPLSLGFTVILLMTEAVVRRFFSKQVVLKKAVRAATLLKRDSNTGFFPVKLATFLRTPVLRNTSGGCFWYDFENHDMVLFAGLLILISFRFKLYMILMNLVKVNHLIYCVQEKIPKIKRLIQCVKSVLGQLPPRKSVLQPQN